MSMFNLFRRRGSAPVARDRLQILLAHERAARGQSDLLAILREEIMAVIAKHVTVERDNVLVRLDRGVTVSTLEIDVEIPNFGTDRDRDRVVAARSIVQPRILRRGRWERLPAVLRSLGCRSGSGWKMKAA